MDTHTAQVLTVVLLARAAGRSALQVDPTESEARALHRLAEAVRVLQQAERKLADLHASRQAHELVTAMRRSLRTRVAEALGLSQPASS